MVLLIVICFVPVCWSCFGVTVLCLIRACLCWLIMLIFAFFLVWFGLRALKFSLVCVGDVARVGLLIWYLV